jgi:hypothetical protein
VVHLARRDKDEGALVELLVAVCPGCREEGTIDVKLQHLTLTKDGKSTTELCHTTYPGHTLAALGPSNDRAV